MLSYRLSRWLRNSYYRLKGMSSDPYFKVFDAMYQVDPKPFSHVSRLPGKRPLYSIVDFQDPSLAQFKGRELCIFDQGRVACYWLWSLPPRNDNHFLLRLRDFLIPEGLYMGISKKKCESLYQYFDVMPPQNAVEYQTLSGNLLNYSLVWPELKTLIDCWLAQNEQFKMNPNAYPLVKHYLESLQLIKD